MSNIYGIKGPGWKEVKAKLESEGKTVVMTELGNMKHIPVTIGGLTFKSAEAAYQSSKFDDLEIAKSLALEGGINAKTLAYKHKDKMIDRKDGELTRAMFVVLALKRIQNQPWAMDLLSTIDGEVHELSNNKWGITGEDLLGQIMDAVRSSSDEKIREYLSSKRMSDIFPWLTTAVKEESPDKEVKTEMKTLAIIGSRELKPWQFDMLVELAFWAVMHNRRIVTGGAYGADQAAMLGAKMAARAKGIDLKDVLTVYLPWTSYNEEIVPAGCRRLSNTWTEGQVELAKKHHPAYDRLSQGAQKMMIRNVQIVQDADTVVAWPRIESNMIAGGTAHGVNVAKSLDRALILMTDDAQRDAVVKTIARW